MSPTKRQTDMLPLADSRHGVAIVN
ncbi:hypothetical protein DSM3645_03383 [Blastopirellula marina DSM 3645]|uniref:Uncharacterized protein n=1 Tax=Blastopirellula marina DSM 3645 TaxID=314230 RepID=A3ZVZ0_9BACT|nr:hypothetical protein DSM3645_03383 [Blastopirellula marina DSM 3645]